jgi:hypothetical protein
MLIQDPEKNPRERANVASQFLLCTVILDPGIANKRASFAYFEENKGRNSLQSRLRGGGRGIRTPGTVSRTSVFKTDCFNHSHIPPRGRQ